MKKYLIIILLILFLPAMGFATNYYVRTDGTNADSDCSESSACCQGAMDQSDFEGLSGTGYAGDTFYFCDDGGNYTTRVDVSLSGTTSTDGSNDVVLDGYPEGDCDPLNSTCTSSAILEQGMQVSGEDYLVIQDFRMTRDNSTQACFSFYGGVSDCVLVRRNYVYETNGTMFYFYGGNYVIIENNKFTHFGQNGTDATQGVNFIGVDHALIQDNKIGHNEASYPSGCTSANNVEVHDSHYMLWEHNDIYGAPNQAGISFKEGWDGNSNVIFRFNKIHDNAENGTGMGGDQYSPTSYAYVYGNFLYNNGNAGSESELNAQNIYFWSNIIAVGGEKGYSTATWGDNPGGINIHYYNNTIAYTNSDGVSETNRTGISIASGTSGFYIKNNLFYNNRPTAPDGYYNQMFVAETASIDYNTVFHSTGTATWYYAGGIKTLAQMQALDPKQEEHGEVADPGFTNPDGADTTNGTVDDDYTLTSAGTAGVTLTGSFPVNISNGNEWFLTNTGYSTVTVNLNEALDPSTTDWTTTPPTVNMVSRDTYGWSRGAYVYGVGAGDTTKPTPNPATFSSAPAGASTTSIAMTATTGSDVNTISIQFLADPGSDSCGSNADYTGTGESDQTWTEEDYTFTDSGLDVNQYYCYNVQLKDSIPNTGTVSSTAGCYTLAATPGAPTLGNAGQTTFDLTANDANGNPAATNFACQVTDSSPYDSAWHGKWIDSSGDPQAAEQWYADSTWDGTITVGNTALNSNTTYKVACKAKNGDDTETALSTEAEITTDYPPGSGEDETISDLKCENLKWE